MPIPCSGTLKYRVKHSSKGNVRLAFCNNKVEEAKNMKTGAVHTPEEFARDNLKSKAKKRFLK